MENLIKRLNRIYLLWKSPNEVHDIWKVFEETVIECRNKMLKFEYLRFNNNRFQFSRENIDEETLGRIEACNVSIRNIEEEMDDPLILESEAYKQFLKNQLIECNRERDFLFAVVFASAEFHQIDDATIGYTSCINPIVDYKLKYYIGKHYGF